MFSVTFIKRPILAMVISLIIITVGLVSMFSLPIAEFPDVAPPKVTVKATYTGANAFVVEDSVTSVLERKINGIAGMVYMDSASTSSGESIINVYFEPGYDLDIGAVDVQNKVATATPQLPYEVNQQGVIIDKQSPNLVCLIAVTGDERYSELFLSNYVTLNVLDEIRRIKGIGKAEIFGEKRYSMRVWLDPDKLKTLGLTPMDISAAIASQNQQASIGKIGAPPTFDNQQLEITLTTQGRLSEVEEFEDIVVKYKKDGSLVYLKDIARVELGAEKYSMNALSNRGSAGVITVYQLGDANALEIREKIEETMQKLSKRFPEGINILSLMIQPNM